MIVSYAYSKLSRHKLKNKQSISALKNINKFSSKFVLLSNRLLSFELFLNRSINMKTLIISFFMLASSGIVSAQLKTTVKCPDIDIDILDGIVNKTLLPTSTVGQIKLNLPCFTSFEDVGTTSKCGAGVFL